jgi:hypothetical protein
VQSGEVDPSLPGERLIHGTRPGAHGAFEMADARVMQAAQARARRSDAVVEMDYTDYSAEPGDEAEHEGPEDEADLLPDEEGFEPEPYPEPEEVEYARSLVVADDATALRLAGIEAEMVEVRRAVEEVGDLFSRGLVAMASGLSTELGAFRNALIALGEAAHAAVEPEQKKRPWWAFWRS